MKYAHQVMTNGYGKRLSTAIPTKSGWTGTAVRKGLRYCLGLITQLTACAQLQLTRRNAVEDSKDFKSYM